ncbi:hypothetical protein T3A99_01340 [Pseudomonas sp. N-137]|uniref:hypothetical protein n=1 Tax=unclassified Pseudomonas TaxID=196821 RepID=UPI0023635BFA|nr:MULTISPECIES: hypothetical protein [unclassified Pseudomonas]MDD2034206.1 hypothetical protein [Pseudomonas sp. 39167]MEA1027205.1 hypothetical protein [Pseudomonas sp. N-137]
MEFPSEYDFLEKFGMEPVEVDPGLALCRYIKKSESNQLEVDVSFSAVMRSFQIVLRISEHELVNVSSENVRSIKLVRDGSEAGMHVLFDVGDTVSEAKIILEPEISCRWWILQNT